MEPAWILEIGVEPPTSEEGGGKLLSAASGVAYRKSGHLSVLELDRDWTEAHTAIRPRPGATLDSGSKASPPAGIFSCLYDALVASSSITHSPFKAFQPTRNTALTLKTKDLMQVGVGWSRLEKDAVNAIYNAILCSKPSQS